MSKRTKMIILVILIVLILLTGAYLYYTLSLQERTKERNAAIASARSQAQLTEVKRADKWVWGENSIFWVIQGTTDSGEEEYVWLKYTSEGTPAEGENALRTLAVNGTVTREDMRSRFEAEYPDAKLVRMLPGIHNNQYVWQIFYEQNDKHYYQFYNLKDGSAIGEAFEMAKW
ncbi:DUF5590 domain-containing protein [Saccharibacillus kuerlensis]|uniref:DUF5590 domain-containing protein n=1 Tax=Saccharibacillus kuerlensis TaxID=459527 RepID=A0ABQ2L5E0_9BACL|nr:DUF5590 domain-containing protein [Saccharibacillus kuerlensis]GGO04213.1 hypothetical protein GCM10010969_29240 [Saccharibacillus kuerlensis]